MKKTRARIIKFVTPAIRKSGSSNSASVWIPAFAGMTAALFLLCVASIAQAQAPSAAPATTEESTLLQLEPLIITAPRLQLAPNAVLDPQINQNLLRLLQTATSLRPNAQEQLDSSLNDLSKLTTLDGYNLQTRYTQLGFLLTEGLAGTKDFTIQNALQSIIQTGTNVQIQAAAMAALAYTKDSQYIPLFQSALQNTSATIRFGAFEALSIMADGTNANINSIILTAAQADPSLAVKLYASQLMWKMGDIFGRETLLHHYQDTDWFARAFSTHYLGEMGQADVYALLKSQLYSETNPSVQAELCWALLRLKRYQNP